MAWREEEIEVKSGEAWDYIEQWDKKREDTKWEGKNEETNEYKIDALKHLNGMR